MPIFLPQFDGRIDDTDIPGDFSRRLEERVRTGLFVPGQRSRANYEVRTLGPRVLFRAANLATAIAIGLNDVEVEAGHRSISYHVRFWTWTLYGVALCAVIGASIAAFGLFWGREMWGRPRDSWFFWLQVVFWGIAWPWILTAFHKPFAARALERVLREVLQAPANAEPR
jgi:hypothetical protein